MCRRSLTSSRRSNGTTSRLRRSTCRPLPSEGAYPKTTVSTRLAVAMIGQIAAADARFDELLSFAGPLLPHPEEEEVRSNP